MKLVLKIKLTITFLLSLCLTACVTTPNSSNWTVEAVSLYDSGRKKGTEIISVQQKSLQAVLSNFAYGEVELLDVNQPEHIKKLARYDLKLNLGEELTSVAFHPSLDIFAAVIDAGNRPGRLQLHTASTGTVLQTATVGFGPDAVVFSKDGNVLMVANEGEDFLFEASSKQFFSPEGSISIIKLDDTGRIDSQKNLELANVINQHNIVITRSGRFMEREIDWNGDGKISKTIDFDGNGRIEKKKVFLGYFEGRDVFGTETSGEKKILIPIMTHSAALLEPEYIAITPDSSKAFVTLQEDDAVAVVDINQEQVVEYYGLGIARHNADSRYNGWVKFNQTISGLREPDGITTILDGRYFVTADEGDTDVDPDDKNNQLLSGGRSISVFNTETGALVGDTGNQLDEVAFANHVYPEQRSNKKGSEPEMLVSFELDDKPFVAVAMERAASVELISLENPQQPKVVSLGKIAGDEDKSPEGIAHFELHGEHYVLTANEMSGTVECFKIFRRH